MAATERNETEFLIPAPVLTSSNKLFDFGVIAFSVPEMMELIAVGGLIFLLWQMFFFLPWQIRLAVAVLVFFAGFLFITQPINGLPGDMWIRHAFRFYVLDRNRHVVYRRGRNYLKLESLRLIGPDGTVIVEVGGET